MIPVILSGGNGSRLWPLSRQMYPKQFLPLVGDSSMFQQTLQRLPQCRVQAPLVVANEAHRFIISEQLEALRVKPRSILLEPFGRNTAPAVALAAMQILAEGQDDIMLVLPADHLINELDRFHVALEQACVAASAGKLVLFGITPRQPETGYGYIRASQPECGGLRVERFVEKPDLATASAYVASGEYYWNSGMFMFSARTFLEELRTFEPDIYDTCQLVMQNLSQDKDFFRIPAAIFEHCPDNSIDYAVMERTSRALLVPLDAGWNDVGSWSSLWEVQPKDAYGNVLLGDVTQIASQNCYVRGDGKLVTLLGVDDLVVVDTKDAVLIAHRSCVQDVKTLVNQLKAEERSEVTLHREVVRPWGSYDSVDQGARFQVKRICVKPGASLSLQKHYHRAEHWIVVKGTARITCDSDVFLLSENKSTYIPVGSVHRLENPGKILLEIIEVQSGTYLGEDDIERFEDNYGRTSEPQVTVQG